MRSVRRASGFVQTPIWRPMRRIWFVVPPKASSRPSLRNVMANIPTVRSGT